VGFSVDKNGLAAWPSQVDRLREDAVSAKKYVEDQTDINWTGEGIANIIAGGHHEVYARTFDFFNVAGTGTFVDYANAAKHTLAAYTNTDQAGGERIDSTYPGVGDADARAGGLDEVDYKVGRFADVVDAQAMLTPIKDYDPEFPLEPDWTHLVSPAAWVRDGIYKVTEFGSWIGACDRAYDPYELILKPLIGDWAGIRACADMFQNLAASSYAMAMNVNWSAQRMPEVWQGKASEHAIEYIYQLANNVNLAVRPFGEMAKHYESAAKSCNDTRGVVSDLLDGLLDSLAAALLAAGAASAIAASGFGLPIALILAGVSVSEIYLVARNVVRMVKVVADLKTVVDTVEAAQGKFGVISKDLELPTLPTVPELP